MTGHTPIGVISTRSNLPVFDEEVFDDAPLPKDKLLATLAPETAELLSAALGPDWTDSL
jgi:hypothetical protein